MVNIDDFVKRLEIILDYYSLNASSFADKIGVQRSSMSHLLSGRNKPSLDFVMKILDVFPDVDLYWILNGKGSFPKKQEEALYLKHETISETEKSDTPTSSQNNHNSDNLFSEARSDENNLDEKSNNQIIKNAAINLENNEIEKIVFFYKNGTFKVYNP